jgi:release factor glutamine methyltransferase
MRPCTARPPAEFAATPTVVTLLAQAQQELRESATPRLDAELLLARALEIDRVALYTQPGRPVSYRVARRYRRWVRRRADGVPLAYLLGRREFWSFEVEVTVDTLVPRPETEHLVDQAHRLIGTHRLQTVADLGTGTGVVALAIQRDRPGVRVVATDLSRKALAVARRNAHNLGLGQIAWIAGDWLEPLAHQSFDLIVSNPPYVSTPELECAGAAIRCEPRLALDGGPDGLGALRAIVQGAPSRIKAGGWIALERGASQGNAVRELLLARGFQRPEGIKDYAGHERVSLAQWP